MFSRTTRHRVRCDATQRHDSRTPGLDIYSAWRGLPDLQIGIVHSKSDQHLDKILALLSRTTTGRVGISARFDDLRAHHRPSTSPR